MNGTEYSIDYLCANGLLVHGFVRENHDPDYPWTREKQKKFLELFTGEKFFFEGEVGSMCIVEFRVDRQLKGDVQAYLYKETSGEYLEHVEAWGERPDDIGVLDLKFSSGKPCVRVFKTNSLQGQPSSWSNQNWKK